MKKIVYVTAIVVSLAFIAKARDLSLESLGFIAPQIAGKANVYSPQSGEILYDSSDSTFYGRDHSSNWISLGGASAVVPTGSVITFAGATCPTGYVTADGSAISRTTYSGLYTVVGTAHGTGDGSTTFNLPDYRGRFLRGIDGSAGNDPDKTGRTAMATGGNSGNNIGSVQSDEFASHNHGSGQYISNAVSGAGGSFLVASASAPQWTGTAVGGNETRPKNAYVNFCIKY